MNPHSPTTARSKINDLKLLKAHSIQTTRLSSHGFDFLHETFTCVIILTAHHGTKGHSSSSSLGPQNTTAPTVRAAAPSPCGKAVPMSPLNRHSRASHPSPTTATRGREQHKPVGKELTRNRDKDCSSMVASSLAPHSLFPISIASVHPHPHDPRPPVNLHERQLKPERRRSLRIAGQRRGHLYSLSLSLSLSLLSSR